MQWLLKLRLPPILALCLSRTDIMQILLVYRCPTAMLKSVMVYER